MPAATARTLSVGPAHALQVPSQAALVARAGDRIEIAAGTYADCAVWLAPRVTIVGLDGGATITGPSCLDKGLFVVVGSGISGLTFRGARDSEHNGAGIRVFGDDLSVTRSRFLDNENGILAGGHADSALVVTDSEFRGNGSCEGACAHGIYAGQAIALLRVERCVFADTRVGHHIKSRARATVVVGNRIEDGAEGTASYLIDVPDGGNVLIQDNVLQKGQLTQNTETAISLGEEGAGNPTGVVIVRDNVFTNALDAPTVFVRNRTGTPAALSANRLNGLVTPLEGAGAVAP
ncbi:MAG: right-handed parallel beta-helix repeat-containing protein [Acetobacteraceae bacterium]|nr:right-handed parallel beta-helix repeat-containing protein [Acetobacteraceae bacterium]